jgi:MFS transporter, DHA3 family, macrolide efflux protein
VLAHPQIRRVVVARFVSRVGGEAAFFVGIWGKAAFVLGVNASQLAVIMGALGVASLIGTSIAGVLIDRFNPRRVVMVGEALFIPVALSLIFADSVPTMAVAAFFFGLVGGPVHTAIASFAPFLTEKETELGRVNSAIEAGGWLAFIVGPALGALIAATVGVDGIFVLNALTAAAAAVLVSRVVLRPKTVVRDLGSTGFSEFREGLRFAYGNPRLRFYVLLGSSVFLLFGFFSSLEPLFFRDVLGVEIETLGWVNALFGIGMVTGTRVSGRLPERYRTAQALTFLVALNAVGVVAYVGTNLLPVVATAGVVWGVVIGTMVPLHRTLLQINSPEHMVGRVMSVNQMHSEGGHLIPLTFAPALAAVFGVQSTLIYSGVVVLVASALFWPGARRLDSTRLVDVPIPEVPEAEAGPLAAGH